MSVLDTDTHVQTYYIHIKHLFSEEAFKMLNNVSPYQTL